MHEESVEQYVPSGEHVGSAQASGTENNVKAAYSTDRNNNLLHIDCMMMMVKIIVLLVLYGRYNPLYPLLSASIPRESYRIYQIFTCNHPVLFPEKASWYRQCGFI
jgi:hypothetical protein